MIRVNLSDMKVTPGTQSQKVRFFTVALMVSVSLHAFALMIASSFDVEARLTSGKTVFKISFKSEHASLGGADARKQNFEPLETQAVEQLPPEQKPTKPAITESKPTKLAKITEITPEKLREIQPVIVAKTDIIDRLPDRGMNTITDTDRYSDVIIDINTEDTMGVTQTVVDAPKPNTGTPQLPTFILGSARNPKPEYPMSARRRGWQGKVMLGVTVGDDGLSETVTVLNSSGYSILDQAALTTIRDQWVFTLAYTQTAVEPYYVTVPISFQFD